jgi:tetratricopeptide (TPR) repeat protein
MKRKTFILLLAFLVSSITTHYFSEAQEKPLNPTLEHGIGEFKHENYEEALPILQKAREEEPESTMAAYYLGLNYKQQQRFVDAIPELRFAVTHTPKIKGALIELIDSLYQTSELEEAKQWIGEAEREAIRPAQVAFLKGLVLVKEENNQEAIKAFENAKSLDKFMEQACDYQIGIARLKLGEYNYAENAFKSVVNLNRSSNMALYANEYIDALTRRQKAAKPWNMSAGLYWQYDDNVVLLPGDQTVATNISDKADSRQVYTMMLEHNHRFSDDFSLTGQYYLYNAKQNDLGFYDTMTQTVAIQPNFTSPNTMLSFPITYSHSLVDERSYLSNPAFNGVYNFMIGGSQMGQVNLRYDYKDYLWTPSTPEENRDGSGLGGGFGWYGFFAKRQGFVNLRYFLNNEWAKGNNWGYLGNRISASVLVPILKKLNLTISGGTLIQKYDNIHTVYNERRKDNVYSGSALLAYKIFKDHEFQIQYSHIRDDSNLTIYDYKRNIYSAGIQLRF